MLRWCHGGIGADRDRLVLLRQRPPEVAAEMGSQGDSTWTTAAAHSPIIASKAESS
jgi:hypothetical protein